MRWIVLSPVQWIGNSQPIAAKNYLQVTDDHFSKALHSALQQPAVLPRTDWQVTLATDHKTPVFPGNASGCDHLQDGQVPPTQVQLRIENRANDWRNEWAYWHTVKVVTRP